LNVNDRSKILDIHLAVARDLNVIGESIKLVITSDCRPWFECNWWKYKTSYNKWLSPVIWM